MNQKKIAVVLVASLFAAAFALTPKLRAATNDTLRWHDARGLTVEGKGWNDTKSFFDRLPERAEKIVRPAVWSLSHDSAGIAVRFVSDATAISVRWKLRKESLAMSHMAASGVSGVDLYVRENSKGKTHNSKLGWRWLGTGRPDKVEMEKTLVSGLTAQSREYMLYLPLYNGVESVEIGVPKKAACAAAPSRVEKMKPLVFYGTSILQGGCAARPGMAYPSIIGRHLDWPAINLGFSGNGWCEPEMAQLLSELDPSIYVLDPLPNIASENVEPRVEPFVKILREKNPKTPIVLVENVEFPDGLFVASRHDRFAKSNAGLRRVFDRLRQGGDKNLFYVSAEKLLGTDGEGTVDGTHPTDLGFLRMADAIEPVLKSKLPKR